ncbi:hypothetical protein DPMN_035449 [Dreissena polymorpha]|uniref:DNA-directed RNA polymerase III subunit RPC4 n=1 Tax=Dreissena polymorpha TaxID=45954 RepID=A0A9D4RL08_DREPO|nr:hypothetical protein DPMN_035449 [Dreissena polymorpha]
MASGDDKSQLPRGLIGRTGAPSGRGARLPSIRGPRDLTLGGVQKKVFTPNIPARRVKQEPSNDQPTPSASKDQSKGKKGLAPSKDDRGRGRGRGRGRNMPSVIQTHSLFEQGPSEKIPKPTGAIQEEEEGARVVSFKREQTDQETKEVLDSLLRDDFLAGKGFEEDDITLMPVKLPIVIKKELKVKQETINIKQEPMDTDGKHEKLVKNDTATETNDLTSGLGNLYRQNSTDSVTCGELFTNPVKSEDGTLLFIQLPDTLPGMPLSTEEDFKKKKDKESEISDKMDSCSLHNFSEGLVGKLIVRKSGRVQLRLGNTLLNVTMGTPCGFLQDVASVRVDGNHGDISLLGHIDHRLVCTPDFESLLDAAIS